MNWIHQIKEILKPNPVECSEGHEHHSPLQTIPIEDEFDAHIPDKVHRVPSFEQFYSPVLSVSQNPDLIKGFRFEVSTPLSQYFQVSNAWNFPNSGTTEQPQNPLLMMPTQTKPTYSLTTQLVRDIKGMQPQTIMMGKVDNEGRVDAILVRKLLPNVSLKLTGSFQSSNMDHGMTSADVQIQQKNAVSVIRAGNGHFGFSYMQRFHPNFMLGFDYTHLTLQKLAFFSYGAKFYLANHSIFARYVAAQGQYNLGYVIPIKHGTQFVANYSYDVREKKPLTTIGFKQNYSQSNITATINSKGEIGTCLNLQNPNFSLKLCALIDYKKDKYSFGYGITLGQAI